MPQITSSRTGWLFGGTVAWTLLLAGVLVYIIFAR